MEPRELEPRVGPRPIAIFCDTTHLLLQSQRNICLVTRGIYVRESQKAASIWANRFSHTIERSQKLCQRNVNISRKGGKKYTSPLRVNFSSSIKDNWKEEGMKDCKSLCICYFVFRVSHKQSNSANTISFVRACYPVVHTTYALRPSRHFPVGAPQGK